VAVNKLLLLPPTQKSELPTEAADPLCTTHLKAPTLPLNLNQAKILIEVGESKNVVVSDCALSPGTLSVITPASLVECDTPPIISKFSLFFGHKLYQIAPDNGYDLIFAASRYNPLSLAITDLAPYVVLPLIIIDITIIIFY